MSRKPRPLSVFVRWRPLPDHEAKAGEIAQTVQAGSLHSLTIKATNNDRPWSSPSAFKTIFNPDDDNQALFDAVVAPAIPKVLEGASCNFFAYGHTGSGKTHTIIGYSYDYEQSPRQLGLSLATAHYLYEHLSSLNSNLTDDNNKLGIGLSFYELRKNTAYDLLNNCAQCYIREGPDGKTHVRGSTQMLSENRVKVQPIAQHALWDFPSFVSTLLSALPLRATGTSTVHDQSSRTHAVLELEIVNRELVNAKEKVWDRQAELVPVGARVTSIAIEEQSKGIVRTPDGGWAPNPDYTTNQARIDEAEAEKAEYEARVTAAEEQVATLLREGKGQGGLGGKFVFVDLAGAEYQQDKATMASQLPKQTPQERQEARQINTDLLALKEVFRAISSKNSGGRIPFRSSPLTMVLREHFVGDDGTSAMIMTVSPAKQQYAATLNSLKYGSLVGVAST